MDAFVMVFGLALGAIATLLLTGLFLGYAAVSTIRRTGRVRSGYLAPRMADSSAAGTARRPLRLGVLALLAIDVLLLVSPPPLAPMLFILVFPLFLLTCISGFIVQADLGRTPALRLLGFGTPPRRYVVIMIAAGAIGLFGALRMERSAYGFTSQSGFGPRCSAVILTAHDGGPSTPDDKVEHDIPLTPRQCYVKDRAWAQIMASIGCFGGALMLARAEGFDDMFRDDEDDERADEVG